MARRETLSCDLCGQGTERIVAKLTLVPAKPGSPLTHSNYTAHADVGECCAQKVTKMVKWQKRLNKSQYIAKRKKTRERPKAAK